MNALIYGINLLFAAAMPVTHIAGYIVGFIALALAARFRRDLVREPAAVGILALVLYAALRTMTSEQPAVGWGATYGYFAHWLLPFVAGYIAARADGSRVSALVSVFTIAFLALFVVGLAAYVNILPHHVVIPRVGDFILVEDGLLKGLRSHISLASICLIILFLHLQFLRAGIARRRSIAAIAVSLVVLVLTGSRGYYIAAAVSLAAYGCWYAVTTGSVRHLAVAASIAALLAVAVYTGVPALRQRLDHTGPRDTNVQERLALYSVAVSEVRDRPWFGFGPGQAIKQTRYFTQLPPERRDVGRHPHLHSFYLNFTADLGSAGVLLLGAVLWSLLSGTWRMGAAPDAFTAALGRGVFWALLAVLAGDCFDALLRGPWTAMELFWLAGLALGLRRSTA